MIHLECPAQAPAHGGNRVTANRWSALLLRLGVRSISHALHDEADLAHAEMLIALHARKSARVVQRYRKLRPDGPIVVALTGTDLYHDIRTSKAAQRSLELADRLVVLQPRGVDELPARLRPKARVIIQSAEPVGRQRPERRRPFKVAVLGHLRSVKDPFRTALAVRQLPADLRIVVTHVGKALTPAMERRARALAAAEPRYRWLGEVSYRQARRLLARSHVLVVSSRLEGGANVICEALSDGVPVVASAVSGNIGLLWPGYPGYFPLGDTAALAELLRRAATDQVFYAQLESWCAALWPMVSPAKELAGWRALLDELLPSQHKEG